MLHLFTDVAFSFPFQQRMHSASTAERVKALAIESSDAETFLQQLDKLRTIYDDYKKLLEETIPLAEKNLNQRLADESQKEQTFDDVSFLISSPSAFNFRMQIVDNRARGISYVREILLTGMYVKYNSLNKK